MDDGSSITTVNFPAPLPMAGLGDYWVARAGDIELRFSNLTKIFWPEDGLTKGDVLTYYFNVAPTMLPHLDFRPLTLKRQPEGIDGPYWYEKDAPGYTPAWLPTLSVEAKTEKRTIRFATVRDVASLLWLANVGCVEFHPHHTRGEAQTNPTYAVFDLDPFPPATFDDARHAAGLVRVVLEELELASYPKTSGATGLQIYVPLDGAHTYEEVRATVVRLCRLVERADPARTTLEWDTSKRAGKVFLDANMNRAGATLVAPYSLRARPGAPVSTPVTWVELDEVDPRDLTIRTVPRRVREVGDVFAPVYSERQSLAAAIEAVGRR